MRIQHTLLLFSFAALLMFNVTFSRASDNRRIAPDLQRMWLVLGDVALVEQHNNDETPVPRRGIIHNILKQKKWYGVDIQSWDKERVLIAFGKIVRLFECPALERDYFFDVAYFNILQFLYAPPLGVPSPHRPVLACVYKFLSKNKKLFVPDTDAKALKTLKQRRWESFYGRCKYYYETWYPSCCTIS